MCVCGGNIDSQKLKIWGQIVPSVAIIVAERIVVVQQSLLNRIIYLSNQKEK
jgi:hypothetical protein